MLEYLEERDRSALGTFSGLELPFLEGAMSSITGLGSVYLATLFLWVAWSSGMKTFVLETLTGLAALWMVSYSMKYTVRRDRPADRHRSAVGYSFPSGHSATAFYLAVMFSTVLPYGGFLYVVAGMVAFSRIYLRLHYPLDAVLGASIGLLTGHLALLLL